MDKIFPANCGKVGGLIFLGIVLFFSAFCEKRGIINPISKELENQVRISEFSSIRDDIGVDGETTDITIKLVDGTGDPFQDGIVAFQSALGTITPKDTSDGEGIAHAVYTSGSTAGLDTITASVENAPDKLVQQQLFLTIIIKSSLTVSANPAEIPADETSSSVITVVVKNSLNNPVENAEISFTTDLGRIAPTAITDEIGVAKADIFSERTDGIATVTATYLGTSKTTKVRFIGTQLSVTAIPEALVADGVSSAAVIVTLKDGADIPIESAQIELQTDNGTFTNDSTIISGVTDVSGTFIDSLKSTEQVVTTITALGAGTQVTTTVSFTQLVTSLVAAENTITANDSVRLTFTIVELDGTPREGVRVIFFTTLGDVIPSESVTDSNGTAHTYLRSSIGGAATVTAQVTGGLIAPTPSSVEVAIVSAPPASLRLIIDPVVVAVNGGQTNLTAIVTDASSNPVPDQTVSFKIVQGPGGGETISPPFATTDETGSARSVFQAGSIGSKIINSVVISAKVQGTALSEEAQLTIAGEPKSIKTSPSPPPADNQDGTFSLALGSIVSDINGNPVNDGTLVHYSTNPPIGVIVSPVGTVEGKVSTALVYPIDAAGNSITVIATSGGISDTLFISQLPTAGVAGFVDSIRVIGAGVNSIVADGQSTTQFRVLVVDPTKNPVAGVIVDFSARPGNSGTGLTEEQTLPEGAQNPSWGVAAFTLRSESLIENVYPEIEISAGGRTIIYQKNGIPDPVNPFFYRGITLTMDSEKDTINVGETVNIRVVLKETTSNVALSEREVTFGSNLGLIANAGETDDRGEILIPFDVGLITGLARITATFGTNITDSTFVYVAEEEPAPTANIFLSADTSVIKVQGTEGLNSAGITVRVTNANNSPVADAAVKLSTSLGFFFFESSPGFFDLVPSINLVTDAQGEVHAQLLSSTTSGVATITASSRGISVSKGLITIQAGSPENVIVSADTLGTLLPGNSVQITVAAIVSDINGNPIAAGTQIVFNTESDGSGDNPTVTIVTEGSTDAFGIAQSTLTYTVADIGKGIRIRATAGTLSSTTDIKLPIVE